MAEGGWSTQSDAYSSGRASSPACPVCGAAEGTFRHRLTEYTGAAAARDNRAGLLAKLDEAGPNPLLDRGIPIMKNRGMPVEDIEEFSALSPAVLPHMDWKAFWKQLERP